jgi:hypothetical protein
MGFDDHFPEGKCSHSCRVYDILVTLSDVLPNGKLHSNFRAYTRFPLQLDIVTALLELDQLAL